MVAPVLLSQPIVDITTNVFFQASAYTVYRPEPNMPA